MDQSEGRILYHVTGFTASVFLEVWDRVFLWGLVPLGQHGIEATGSDVIKPEIDDRPRGLAKTHFYSTFWTSLRTLGRSRWNVRGVRIILKVIDCGPEAREPDLCEGDLVGVVGIREGFRFIISG